MVLSETRGLWLSWIVREGIGWSRRLACLKHGPDFSSGYFLSNPGVSRTRQLPPGIVPRWNGQGEPLKTAQAQLGHASLSTTAEIYAQAVPASQRAAVERLEKAVGFLVDPKSRG